MLQPPFQSNKVPLPAEPPKTIAKCVYFAKKRLEVHVVYHFRQVRSHWPPFFLRLPAPGLAPDRRGSKEGDHPTIYILLMYIYIIIYIASDRFEIRSITVGLASARPPPPPPSQKKRTADSTTTRLAFSLRSCTRRVKALIDERSSRAPLSDTVLQALPTTPAHLRDTKNKLQRLVVSLERSKDHAKLLQHTSTRDKAQLLSQAGRGACGFLASVPSLPELSIPLEEMRMSVRRWLRIPMLDAALDGPCICSTSSSPVPLSEDHLLSCRGLGGATMTSAGPCEIWLWQQVSQWRRNLDVSLASGRAAGTCLFTGMVTYLQWLMSL